MFKALGLYLSIAGASMAASFPLGLDFSARIGGADSPVIAAVDAAGSLYLLQTASTSFVTKLNPDGKQVVYMMQLGFVASAMAVDSAGSVYVAGLNLVAKLENAGAGFVYQNSIAPGITIVGLAADNAGHAFVTGYTSAALPTTAHAFQATAPAGNPHAFVVKLNASGAGFDYATYVAGSSFDMPASIAVNSAGEAFVIGQTGSSDFPITPGAYNKTAPLPGGFTAPFLTRLSADGSSLIYSTFTGGNSDRAIAVAAQGSGEVYQQSPFGATLLRLNKDGSALDFSRTLPASVSTQGTLAVDSAGNTYATGFTAAANFPTKNTLASCGPVSVYLTVLDPAGNFLQSTYVGGPAGFGQANALALAPNGAVYVVSHADSGDLFLSRLSASTPAQTVNLGCLGNAANFESKTLSPGEIISIFGTGLGPLQFTAPPISIFAGFPTSLLGVTVTFDDIAAPLLYVQDRQINTVVPWELSVGSTTKICATYAATTNCVQRTVSQASPGVFTTDGQYAAALNQDGTINSADSPAAPGSIVAVFATGLGPLTPTQRSGSITMAPLATNILPIKVGVATGSLAGVIITEDPVYAGPAPFEVSGASQINLRATASTLYIVIGPDFYAAIARTGGFLIHVASR